MNETSQSNSHSNLPSNVSGVPASSKVETSDQTKLSAISSFFERILERLSPARRRKHWRRQISSSATKRLEIFENLNSLTASEKSRIRVAVRHCMNRLAAVYLWSEWITAAQTTCMVTITVFGAFIVPPIVVQKWIGTHHSFGTWALLYLGYIYAWLLSLAIAVGPLLLVPKAGDHPYFRFLYYPLSTWTVAVIFVYGWLVYRVATNPHIISHHWAFYLWVAAMLGTLVYGAALVVLAVLTAMLSYALSQRERSLYADALLVNRLVSLLAYIEQNPRQWNQGTFKKKVISKLEELAVGVEVYLFHGFRPRDDNVTEAWLKGRSREIAAALRAFKPWILTPMSDTASHLKQRLSMLLVHAAAGDWNSLERVQAVVISEPRLWRTRILNWAGVILTGGIPLLLFELVQKIPTLMFSDPVAQYVRGGVLIWAALALIAAFDPLFGAKITALKDVLQLLPIPGKKKD